MHPDFLPWDLSRRQCRAIDSTIEQEYGFEVLVQEQGDNRLIVAVLRSGGLDVFFNHGDLKCITNQLS